MTYVLNKCFGGFSLSPFACNALGVDNAYADLTAEHIGKLVELIREYGSEKCSGSSAKLTVVEIPDNFTDIEWDDYDGIERITYVVDGKIYHA